MATATTLKPPTTPAGYMEDSSYWSVALAEFGEVVPDLMWPTSVFTYAQMRKDPQLVAVREAYTLPIRKASWYLDPSGCRDEVVRLIADDMGLRIKGDDEQTAARVQGVSWREHIQGALSMLTYGHAGFEQQAEIRNEKARLISLSQRMPWTIGDIRINPDGSLAGIDQWSRPGDKAVPQIDANRLTWYCRDREGAAWQGQSLLRPAFAPWLLKREMMRVHATSNRRFGMGVPTVRALPGTSPTPAQEMAAQKLASSARVGEQGGASLPPGYVLELIGLSGSVPDTKAFLDWLDQQMSRAALAGFLDLGNTKNGSRALGESFINFFLLAIQTVADDIADVATRQIAARIVEWNWGKTEPVPSVCVADVGSDHAVTAEAIHALVQCGALQPDPELDAYCRREWKIPQRSVPYVEPLPAPTPQQADPTQATVRRRKPRTVSAGQQALPFAAASPALRRDLTDVEAASGADFATIQQQWQDGLAQAQAQWPTLIAPAIEVLATAAGAAVAAGALADLGSLAVEVATLQPVIEFLAVLLDALGRSAAADVVAEAASQGVTIAAGEIDTDRMEEAASAVVQVIVSGYANGASRKAMLLAGPGATADGIAAAVTEALEAMGAAGDGGWVAVNLASALSMAQHAGRFATLSVAPVVPDLVASEVLDANCCTPCVDIDGTVFATIAAALEAYPTGRYHLCLGETRCRGVVLGLWAKAGS